MENQLENQIKTKIENDMETGGIYGEYVCVIVGITDQIILGTLDYMGHWGQQVV